MNGYQESSNKKIVFLFLGFLVLVCLVFALGVYVGKGRSDLKPTISEKYEEEVKTNENQIQEEQITMVESETDNTVKIENGLSEKEIELSPQAKVNLQTEKTHVTNTKSSEQPITIIGPLPPITPDGQYTVQIGSFKNESHAKKLQNKLKIKGYPAFLKQVELAQGTWFRVRVGSFENSDIAKNYADILLKKETELVKSAYPTLNN
jgi:cell division septation protein DedD